MKTGVSKFCFQVNVSSYINKKLKQIIVSCGSRMVDCCVSVIISHVLIKSTFFDKFLAKIQISISLCNVKVILVLIFFSEFIHPHINKSFNIFIISIFCDMIQLCRSSIINFGGIVISLKKHAQDIFLFNNFCPYCDTM